MCVIEAGMFGFYGPEDGSFKSLRKQDKNYYNI